MRQGAVHNKIPPLGLPFHSSAVFSPLFHWRNIVARRGIFEILLCKKIKFEMVVEQRVLRYEKFG